MPDDLSNKNVTLRPYEPGDESQIVEQFNQIFNNQRSLEYWYWAFRDNPYVKATPSSTIIGEHNGRVISQYASIVHEMYLENESISVSEILDNYIVPDFRGGRSLQKEMLRAHTEQAKSRGDAFSIGCPNGLAYKVAKRILGNKDLFTAARLTYRLSFKSAIIKRLSKRFEVIANIAGQVSSFLLRYRLRYSSRYKYNNIIKFSTDADILWDEAKTSFKLLMVRDRAYLNWKYCSRPDADFTITTVSDNIKLLGWTVTYISRKAEQDTIGYLVDFIYIDDDAIMNLIKYALSKLSASGVDYVIAMSARGSKSHKILDTLNFVEKDNFEPIKLIMQWDCLSDAKKQSIVLDPSNWHLAYGDFDLEL